MDERVERARRYVDEVEHVIGSTCHADRKMRLMKDLVAAYDDLAARREQDIREAVEVERAAIVRSIDAAIPETGDINDWDRGMLHASDIVTSRGKATDSATIRREERERTIEDCVEVAAKRFEQYMDNVEKYNLWAVTDVINDVIVNPLRSLTDPQESKP